MNSVEVRLVTITAVVVGIYLWMAFVNEEHERQVKLALENSHVDTKLTTPDTPSPYTYYSSATDDKDESRLWGQLKLHDQLSPEEIAYQDYLPTHSQHEFDEDGPLVEGQSAERIESGYDAESSSSIRQPDRYAYNSQWIPPNALNESDSNEFRILKGIDHRAMTDETVQVDMFGNPLISRAELEQARELQQARELEQTQELQQANTNPVMLGDPIEVPGDFDSVALLPANEVSQENKFEVEQSIIVNEPDVRLESTPISVLSAEFKPEYFPPNESMQIQPAETSVEAVIVEPRVAEAAVVEPRVAALPGVSLQFSDQTQTVSIGNRNEPADRIAGREPEVVPVKTWPGSVSLQSELDYLLQFQLTYPAANSTQIALASLNSTALSNRVEAKSTIQQFRRSISELDQTLDSFTSEHLSFPEWSDLYAATVRTRLKLARRVTLWDEILFHMESVNGQDQERVLESEQAILNLVQNAMQSLHMTGGFEEWNNYLLLDKIENVYSNEKFKHIHRQAIARKFLARIESSALNDQQYRFALSILSQPLIEFLTKVAAENVDHQNLLELLESYEAEPFGQAAYNLNATYQGLYFSRKPADQRLASAIDSAYRNANFRIGISDDLLNRWLPQPDVSKEPVRDRILGAQVFGDNRITNQLSVGLQPDPQRINVYLQTAGTIWSRTRAHHSGFIFHNSGNSTFQGRSNIVVDKNGVYANSAQVKANSNQDLLGIRSNLDSIPVFGWAARQMAERQQRSKAPIANRTAEQKIANMTRTRFNEEVNRAIGQMRGQFEQRVLMPLNSLELNPTAVELATTRDEVVVRYRLAGLEQMGSFSARPQPVPGNLMNMQLHESAVNNLISKMELNNKKFTAEEFLFYMRDLMGAHALNSLPTIPEDHNAEFTFASRDGVHLAFDENRVRISLNLRRLKLGTRQLWKNFRVSASYIPVTDGQQLQFMFDPERGISVKGSSLSVGDQLALRTIFYSIFPESHTMPSIAQMVQSPGMNNVDLTITQLVFSHGWLGISMGQTQGVQQNYPPNNQATGVRRPRLGNLRQRIMR